MTGLEIQGPGEPVRFGLVPVEPVRQGGRVVAVPGNKQGVSAQHGAGGMSPASSAGRGALSPGGGERMRPATWGMMSHGVLSAFGQCTVDLLGQPFRGYGAA